MKKAFLLFSLSVSLTFSTILSPVSFEKAVATGGEDIVNIGYLYTIETVSLNTKIIVENDTILTYLDDIGRLYSYEWIDVPIGGDDPTPGILGGGAISEPNIIYHRVKQYYYYATPTEPKITGRTMMCNTIASLKGALKYLESLSLQYGCSNTKDSILGYIRTINTSYAGSLWDIVGGTLDTGFVQYVNSLTNIGMTIKEYFASFISSDCYNSTIHANCGTQYLTNNYRLYDPITSYADIDLVHLFACMDAVFLNSNSVNSFPYNLILTPRTYIYLSTWAGDLQTCVLYYSSISTVPTSFASILSDSASKFDYPDFYADIDAINIAFNISLSDTFLLSDLVYNYYIGLSSNQSRVSSFCTNIIHMDNTSNGLTYNNLKAIIYEMLAMDENGNSLPENDYLLHYNIKYLLLGYLTEMDDLPSMLYRYSIGYKFVNYLWSEIMLP